MKNQTKITAKIYAPLLMGFEKKLDSLFIKRDAFLNHIIKMEVVYLAEELKGRRISNKARRYISGQLKKLGTKTINVVVDKETADLLNAVVGESNIVRDAFLNRLIMFLRSSDAVLKYLELPHIVNRSEFDSIVDEMPTSPLGAMQSVLDDPMFYLHIAAKERFGNGLYLLELPENMAGFTCYMEDADISGTKEFEARQKLGEELSRELEEFELQAFSATSAVPSSKGDSK